MFWFVRNLCAQQSEDIMVKQDVAVGCWEAEQTFYENMWS